MTYVMMTWGSQERKWRRACGDDVRLRGGWMERGWGLWLRTAASIEHSLGKEWMWWVTGRWWSWEKEGGREGVDDDDDDDEDCASFHVNSSTDDAAAVLANATARIGSRAVSSMRARSPP